MTKEMEIPAGLFIAASSYAAKSLDETVTQKAADGLHYAFIAGAEWQKSQPLSQAIQMKIDEFELMRKDRDDLRVRLEDASNIIASRGVQITQLEIERRDWADTATDYAQKLHVARVRIEALEDFIPKDPSPKRDGLIREVVGANRGPVHAMATVSFGEATGGFNAIGETQADLGAVTHAKAKIFENFKKSLDEMLAKERGAKPRPTIEERVAHLEQYVFGDAPGIDPEPVDTQGNWRT